ncbi:MAG: branched-chain amino acid ABC transporter permease [Clostridia bacterium]|nr:branched-chain amino acid ABC transporter permease [Clostridia bacterium]
MIKLLETLVNGINQGSLYAIIALGYSMVYGIAKMLNFAHGDVIMVGGYVAYFAITSYMVNPWLAVVISMIVCAALGMFIERVAYKPLRQATSLAVLITAIGVSYFLQNAAQLLWKTNNRAFPSILNLGNIKLFGGELTLITSKMMVTLISLVIMFALTLFTSKTKIGKAMRAVSEDKGAAELMGINVNMTISVTFAIGSALAAIAGVLYSGVYGVQLTPTLGAMPGIKAFTAAVFGGIGSIPGAMLGGVLLGVIESVVRVYISTDLADAFSFAVLIIMLLIRPAGLLGKKVQEKV